MSRFFPSLVAPTIHTPPSTLTWHRAHVHVPRHQAAIRQPEAGDVAVVIEFKGAHTGVEAHAAAARRKRFHNGLAQPFGGHAVQERHLGAVRLLQKAVEGDEDACGLLVWEGVGVSERTRKNKKTLSPPSFYQTITTHIACSTPRD